MNIVGSNALVRFPEVDIDQWNKIFEINVTATQRGIQTCAPGAVLASDDSSDITGTDIVVDGGWFSSASYLYSEWSHHALSLMDKKAHLEEFLHHFRSLGSAGREDVRT
jgi:NAD(P)-dependent dehydrogenase (short-subunit alcohol dehydrogenase family)